MSVKTQAHMYFDFNERQWQTMLYSGRFEYFSNFLRDVLKRGN